MWWQVPPLPTKKKQFLQLVKNIVGIYVPNSKANTNTEYILNENCTQTPLIKIKWCHQHKIETNLWRFNFCQWGPTEKLGSLQFSIIIIRCSSIIDVFFLFPLLFFYTHHWCRPLNHFIIDLMGPNHVVWNTDHWSRKSKNRNIKGMINISNPNLIYHPWQWIAEDLMA